MCCIMNMRLQSKYYSTLCVINISSTLRHLYTFIYIPYPAQIKGKPMSEFCFIDFLCGYLPDRLGPKLLSTEELKVRREQENLYYIFCSAPLVSCDSAGGGSLRRRQ